MATAFSAKTAKLLKSAANAKSAPVRGKAFEDLLCHLFGSVRGVTVRRRNKKNPFQTEEIDVALWNEIGRSALQFLPCIILAECKNWTTPVGSIDVSWFLQKLEGRGCEVGVLFAANGVTGDPQQRSDAHFEIAQALRNGRRLILLTSDDVRGLTGGAALVKLIKEKLCDLVAGGVAI